MGLDAGGEITSVNNESYQHPKSTHTCGRKVSTHCSTVILAYFTSLPALFTTDELKHVLIISLNTPELFAAQPDMNCR